MLARAPWRRRRSRARSRPGRARRARAPGRGCRAASLMPDDVGHLGQPLDRGRQHVRSRCGRARCRGSAGILDGLGDGLEVPVEALLRRLVVVRRDAAAPRRRRPPRGLGEVDRLGGGVRAGAGDHRHPPGHRLDGVPDDVRCARRPPAWPTRRWCRPTDHRRGAGLHRAVDELAERLVVDRRRPRASA